MSAAVLALVSGCIRPQTPLPGSELPRSGDEIVVCGRLFHTGTRVILWTDAGGYDAYRVYRRFSHTDQIKPTSPTSGTETPNRYSPQRNGLPDDVAANVAAHGWSLKDLQQVVDQFVIHYDVCGSSRKCFEVLQDVRGLSVHFMLDVDGTIYQTLDLKDRARHAGEANDRSIGVEIAQMGAYPKADVLSQWYSADDTGHIRIRAAPKGPQEAQCRPARGELIHGRINGVELYQYDFTQAQYAALAHLTTTLTKVLPGIVLEVPRDAAGRVRDGALTKDELQHYRGLLGHYHVTKDKSDPGPAFDWERLLRDTRASAGVPAPMKRREFQTAMR